MKFQIIAETLGKLEKTESQNEMVQLMASLFKELSEKEIGTACYFLIGQVYPSYAEETLGLGKKTIESSIALAADTEKKKVKEKTRELGDVGSVAAEMVHTRKNHFKKYFKKKGKSLSTKEVEKALKKIATTSGKGSDEKKQKTLAALLIEAKKQERKYITRLAAGTMRTGAGDMTVLDALSTAFFGSKEKRKGLEHAYNVSSDLGQVAEVLKRNGLSGVKRMRVAIKRPIKPMLAQRVSELSKIKENIPSEKIAAEEKYDGERIQAHKSGKQVTLFSRRLSDVTKQFPDIVENVKKHIKADKAILDGEAVAFDFDKEEYFPFQKLMRRRRKYDIEKYTGKIPVVYMLFDLLYLDGKSLLKKSYPERRNQLEKISKKRKYISPAGRKVSKKLDEIDEFFQGCIERGLEGIVCKSCAKDSYYRAGAREWSWIKWKKEYSSELSDTFDLVVIGAYSGMGKRKGTYGALLCAAYNKEKDTFESFTKLGTGFSDKQLEELPKKLKKYKTKNAPARVDVLKDMEPDIWFEPGAVLEAIGAEITKSPSHTCARKEGKGLALRFPRFKRWRKEKKPEQATTAKEIMEMKGD